MLGNFIYSNPTKPYFGKDSLKFLNEELPKYGKNVQLVYGGGFIKKAGIYDDVVKNEENIPAKVVYVRNRSKRKEYLCLISTAVNLDEDEIIRIYGKRGDIEVFFKVCKSYLNLSKEYNSFSYDTMTTHTADVFTRYRMLSLESRESYDNWSLGELFLYFSDDKINELVNAFMNALPALLKTSLQAA